MVRTGIDLDRHRGSGAPRGLDEPAARRGGRPVVELAREDEKRRRGGELLAEAWIADGARRIVRDRGGESVALSRCEALGIAWRDDDRRERRRAAMRAA